MEASIINNQNNGPENRKTPTGRSVKKTQPSTQKRVPTGENKSPKPKKSTGKAILFGFLRFIAVCMCLGIIAVSAVAVLLSLYVVEATANDGALLDLDNLKLSYTTVIKVLDRETNQWVDDRRLVGAENREWITLDVIPNDLENAFIAVEDKNFKDHMGFSIKRTTFAVINEVYKKLTGSYLSGNMQGASTINQQLIKNITQDDKQDYGRKIREIFRAISLDNKYSKDIILEAYLNTIGLTGNTAGVQAGAHSYFNKRLGEDELTLGECATIAAITKDPTEFSPTQNPEKHLERRNDILYFMRQQRLISQADYETALQEPLRLAESRTAASTGYNTYSQDATINAVLEGLQAKYEISAAEAERMFYNGGLTVYATYDPKVEETMKEVMNDRKMFPEYRHEAIKKDAGGNNVLGEDGKPIKHEIATQACMVILNYNGEVIASLGGLGEKEGSRTLNRAMEMKRSVGSTMKGVAVYPLGIDQDLINWSSTFMDDFVKLIDDGKGGQREWPQNYEKSYTKKFLTIEEAVRRSVNTIAVRAGETMSSRTLFDFAYDTLQIHSLDIKTDATDFGPMCLGSLSYGMTPLELAGAYMMYGNKGEYVTPHTYLYVENSIGEVILEPDVVRVQAIGEDTAYIMNRLLKNVLGTGGTAPGIGPKTSDGVGKTGTTNETRDVWFAGVTPNYVTATWFGYDSNDSMLDYYKNIKHPGASAWAKIMDTMQEGTENKDFEVSEAVEKKPYCKASGGNPGALCTELGEGYYKKGTELSTCTEPGHY